MIDFVSYIRAGYPLLWLHTYEEDRSVQILTQNVASKIKGYKFYVWDTVRGMIDLQVEDSDEGRTTMADPLAAIAHLSQMPKKSILFVKDFHKIIDQIKIYRPIKNLVEFLKGSQRHLVFLSPVLKIPVELEKDVTIVNFPLPTFDELMDTANGIVKKNKLKIEVPERSIRAGVGLTQFEAENAMALSIVTEKKFSKKIIESEKLQAIKKSGGMELYLPVPESELGGMKGLKTYIHNRKKYFNEEGLPPLKGILLVGLPGGGKSLSAKVIANVFDFPLLRFDIGSLKAGLVGESERRMREALNLIDAIAPVVVWIDEIEKVLGGVQSSNRSDAGTTATMFGYFLTWMQESLSKKYIVATCNDIEDLLSISQGALIRRFDDIFFVDLPSNEERKEILSIMNRRYSTNFETDSVNHMINWTGAEIEKFVSASQYDGRDIAFKNIKPIFKQNQAVINRLKDWAKNNARLANSDIAAVSSERAISTDGEPEDKWKKVISNT